MKSLHSSLTVYLDALGKPVATVKVKVEPEAEVEAEVEAEALKLNQK